MSEEKESAKVVLVEIEHDWDLNLGFHGVASDLPTKKATTIDEIVEIAKAHPDRAILINTLPRECSDREITGIEPPAIYADRMLKEAGLSGIMYKLPPLPPFEAGVVYDANLL